MTKLTLHYNDAHPFVSRHDRSTGVALESLLLRASVMRSVKSMIACTGSVVVSSLQRSQLSLLCFTLTLLLTPDGVYHIYLASFPNL